MSTGKVTLGVLTGLAVGAVLGILMAPDKGSNTVKKMADKSDDFMDDMKEIFLQHIKSVTDKFAEVTEDAKDLGEQAKTKMDGAKDAVKISMNQKY